MTKLEREIFMNLLIISDNLMLSRMRCNGVKREAVQAGSNLASGLFYMYLHTKHAGWRGFIVGLHNRSKCTGVDDRPGARGQGSQQVSARYTSSA